MPSPSHLEERELRSLFTRVSFSCGYWFCGYLWNSILELKWGGGVRVGCVYVSEFLSLVQYTVENASNCSSFCGEEFPCLLLRVIVLRLFFFPLLFFHCFFFRSCVFLFLFILNLSYKFLFLDVKRSRRLKTVHNGFLRND